MEDSFAADINSFSESFKPPGVDGVIACDPESFDCFIRFSFFSNDVYRYAEVLGRSPDLEEMAFGSVDKKLNLERVGDFLLH